jgi:hypothetical protein
VGRPSAVTLINLRREDKRRTPGLSPFDTYTTGRTSWPGSRSSTRSWWVRYPRDNGGYGSVSGFDTKKAANDYANSIEADQRRGTWLDPAAAKTTVSEWSTLWLDTLDVEIRTEENYKSRIDNNILPRWGTTTLGGITALAVTMWIKQLRRRYAVSTVAGIVTVFSMMLDDSSTTSNTAGTLPPSTSEPTDPTNTRESAPLRTTRRMTNSADPHTNGTRDTPPTHTTPTDLEQTAPEPQTGHPPHDQEEITREMQRPA